MSGSCVEIVYFDMKEFLENIKGKNCEKRVALVIDDRGLSKEARMLFHNYVLRAYAWCGENEHGVTIIHVFEAWKLVPFYDGDELKKLYEIYKELVEKHGFRLGSIKCGE